MRSMKLTAGPRLANLDEPIGPGMTSDLSISDGRRQALAWTAERSQLGSEFFGGDPVLSRNLKNEPALSHSGQRLDQVQPGDLNDELLHPSKPRLLQVDRGHIGHRDVDLPHTAFDDSENRILTLELQAEAVAFAGNQSPGLRQATLDRVEVKRHVR